MAIHEEEGYECQKKITQQATRHVESYFDKSY
jgi:hypothetical protein